MIDEYTLLLIKQYWEKPKARSEIELRVKAYEDVTKLLKSIPVELDIDEAVGVQQDLIGRIVGIRRNVASVIPKVFYGFKENDNTEGFSNKSDITWIGAPFYNKFGERYSTQQLNDDQFRRLLKVKVAINNTSSLMVSDERLTMQDAVMQAFGGRAYIVDNQDMSVTLYISPSVPLDEVRLIRRLGLLPKPQAVMYRFVIQAEVGLTFGFNVNPSSMGFSDKFNDSRNGGYFARKAIQ